MFMMAAGGAMAGFQAFQAYKASKAKAAAEMTQYNDQMMKQSMKSGVESFQNASANVNRMIANKAIVTSSLNAYVMQQKAADDSYQYNMSNMAKQVQTQAQSVSTVGAAKVGRNSGTYKLAMAKMKESGATAFAQQTQNKYNTEKDLKTQHANNLNTRDLFSSNQTGALIPGLPPTQPNHTAAAIGGAMQGMQQGMSMGQSFGTALIEGGMAPKWLIDSRKSVS